jgi:hypothetical protein
VQSNCNPLQIFLYGTDELALLINKKANQLYESLRGFDNSLLGNANEYLNYFSKHHLGARLFFSIQNSAHILYQGIKLCNKPLEQINAIDYGAGLGTLFMLGGLLGCRRFDYNDHLPEWQPTAQAVCNAIHSNITHYNIGDIGQVTGYANQHNFTYDLVVSRNVIEHVYDLELYFKTLYRHNSKIVTFNTTTANYHNPAMHLYHMYIHYKTEKKYFFNSRFAEIKKRNPQLDNNGLKKLTRVTRGLGQADFDHAMERYQQHQPLALKKGLGTNTCDWLTGVWSEHLLSKSAYQNIAANSNCSVRFTAGYWDTHYNYKIANCIAACFNGIIKLLGTKKGVWLSPFVNVATYPQNSTLLQKHSVE